MNIGIALYCVMCVLWGVFAARMQHKLNYDKRLYNPLWAVALINAIAAPICMVIAIVRCPVAEGGEDE